MNVRGVPLSSAADLDPREYATTLEILKKIDFFQEVPADQLNTLLLSLEKMVVPPSKVILFQGEISNRLYIIQKGSVVISTKSKGTKIILAELKSTSYFGEISLLRPTSATATVTAGEEGAEVLILSHEALSQMSKKIPGIGERIQKVIDDRIASKKKAKEAEEAN